MSHLASVQTADKNHASQRHALRSQRTRELLLDHMYRLALEKGYEGITVQQLLDSTGVARSTFYAHFRDKEDLIVAGYEAIGTPSTKVTEVDGDRRVLLDVSAWLFSEVTSIQIKGTTEARAANTINRYTSVLLLMLIVVAPQLTFRRLPIII